MNKKELVEDAVDNIDWDRWSKKYSEFLRQRKQPQPKKLSYQCPVCGARIEV